MQRSAAKILTTHVGSLPFLSLDKGVRSHPQIAWAKLRAMVEGAALASTALGFAAV